MLHDFLFEVTMKKENSMPELVKNEESVLKFWSDNKIFEKLKEQNKGSGKYYAFLDGPITANYVMGLHHAWNRSLCRNRRHAADKRSCGCHFPESPGCRATVPLIADTCKHGC